MESNRFYKSASLTHHIIFSILSLAMIGLSIYLSSHYFEVKFPEGMTGSSLCDINSYFNCDVTTHSPASNIFGVPISAFGILIGLFSVFGYLFNNERYEGTLHSLLLLNAVGCILLFLYSLIFLGGLCPFCSLYYIASILALFVFRKTSEVVLVDPLTILSFGVITLISSYFFYSHSAKKVSDYNSIAKSTIIEFKKLKNLGHPEFESKFRIASATEKFTDAPIQITKYSDFECPSCKFLSNTLNQVAKLYKGKVNIQYFFFPLDRNCNPSMKRDMHRHACTASYISVCKPEKFIELEHLFFDNQRSLSKDFMDQLAKKEGISDCITKPETKEEVVRYIKTGEAFNIQSTPTFFINGRKIEGALPIGQVRAIIDYLLKQNQ